MSTTTLPTYALPETAQHLLESNEPPTERDIPCIKEQIESLDAFLSEIDDKKASVPETKDHVLRLETRRAELLQQKERLQSVMAPIRRVPLEILQELFLFATGSSSSSEGADNDLRKIPWILSQVCRRWRRVSLSCTELFTALLNDLPWLASRRDPYSVLYTVLDRIGGNRGLRAHIDILNETGAGAVDLNDDDVSQEEIAFMFALLGTLMERSAQWESATFCMPEVMFMGLSAVRGRVPRLKEVLLHSDNDEDFSWGRLTKIYAFEIAPNLRTLSLHNIPFTSVVLNPLLLESVSDETPRLTDDEVTKALLPVLQACPNLRTLKFVSKKLTIEDVALPPKPAPRLDHAALTSLTVSGASVLCRLTLPHLTELDLGVQPGGHEREVLQGVLPGVIDLLSNSRCYLRRLTFRHCHIPIPCLLNIFALTPHLEKLTVDFHKSAPLANETILALTRALAGVSGDTTRSQTVHTYLPALQAIEFTTFDNQCAFMNTSFVDMLLARHEAGRLKNVKLAIHDVEAASVDPLVSDAHEARFQKMKAGGLRMDATWTGDSKGDFRHQLHF
ncbi:hypothetical protein BDZ89DRAFT_635164 [Hymenopellis radicata]|nr:hypothetical protein BDZ89DRAFT_635164 [Hymenopellis radicata]